MSLYRSPQAQAAAFASYDRVMGLWPVAYEEAWVNTDYGVTHVLLAGPEDAPALFLLPGLFADACMWFANVGALSTRYRVYCLDQITYGGKSEPSALPVKGVEDYVTWFRQVIGHFGCSEVAVGGLSYGSWLALALAREIPEAIRALLLLDPSQSFSKMDGGIAWRGFWAFALFPSRKKQRRFFEWMGGGFHSTESDLWLEHMLDVIEYGSVGMFDVPQHRLYRAEELTMLRMPVLIIAGGKPILYRDPQAFAAAASRALPHAEVMIIADTGHSLNVEKAEVVNAAMLEFLARHATPYS